MLVRINSVHKTCRNCLYLISSTHMFGLDNPPHRGIVTAIRRHFDGPWYNMRSVSNETLLQWWGHFIVSIEKCLHFPLPILILYLTILLTLNCSKLFIGTLFMEQKYIDFCTMLWLLALETWCLRPKFPRKGLSGSALLFG